jgi:hypothetical protein
VKRSSGNDSWGAAPCENSAMPGKTFPTICCLQQQVLTCREDTIKSHP